MISISSSVAGSEILFTEARDLLELKQFTLGGNWDYKSGSFDHALDQEHKVWLRIPFEASSGEIDSEHNNEAVIRLGTPYLLRHLYNEGTDPEGSVRVLGAMFDQFQAPVDPDADISPEWIERGQALMREVEFLIRG
ncbi:YugN family protein [Paenibacillus sp. HB172176]|uniref:YugN family protein n=1 Tax=Paenibacillus sp. HB172176 TaxID=2493690 RepID=UPI0014387FC2|nr:YugN family protein [Paenibacillus sp. HB172176]